MIADPGYRPFQFGIADLLAVMVIVAILGATSKLPVSLLHVIPLFAVLYLAKLRILRLRVRPWMAFGLYLIVLAALLPYLYCRATVDWNSPCVRPQANWIGGPIAVFTVPTASFLDDVLAQKRPSAWFYALRSLVELVMIVPFWTFVWAWIEILILGWVWI
jgi:hypothetical protein